MTGDRRETARTLLGFVRKFGTDVKTTMLWLRMKLPYVSTNKLREAVLNLSTSGDLERPNDFWEFWEFERASGVLDKAYDGLVSIGVIYDHDAGSNKWLACGEHFYTANEAILHTFNKMMVDGSAKDVLGCDYKSEGEKADA